MYSEKPEHDNDGINPFVQLLTLTKHSFKRSFKLRNSSFFFFSGNNSFSEFTYYTKPWFVKSDS